MKKTIITYLTFITVFALASVPLLQAAGAAPAPAAPAAAAAPAQDKSFVDKLLQSCGGFVKGPLSIIALLVGGWMILPRIFKALGFFKGKQKKAKEMRDSQAMNADIERAYGKTHETLSGGYTKPNNASSALNFKAPSLTKPWSLGQSRKAARSARGQ